MAATPQARGSIPQVKRSMVINEICAVADSIKTMAGKLDGKVERFSN